MTIDKDIYSRQEVEEVLTAIEAAAVPAGHTVDDVLSATETSMIPTGPILVSRKVLTTVRRARANLGIVRTADADSAANQA